MLLWQAETAAKLQWYFRINCTFGVPLKHLTVLQ